VKFTVLTVTIAITSWAKQSDRALLKLKYWFKILDNSLICILQPPFFVERDCCISTGYFTSKFFCPVLSKTVVALLSEKSPVKISLLLKNYTQHAEAHLSNNVAERAVRPLALGRKNWLFLGSEEGGEVAAILFSLVQSCKASGVNPEKYLTDVMKRLMGHSAQKLHELLPSEWIKAQAANTS
jgi:hypothetical protein